jgi:hypothetical protein
MSVTVAKQNQKTEEERIQDYIKARIAIDQAIEPFKEQKRDLAKSAVDNGWFSKEKKKSVDKAYSLIKSKVDLDELDSMIKLISSKVSV